MNLPCNSDMRGQTSQPLGSLGEETETLVIVLFFLIFWWIKTKRAQLTSTCASPPWILQVRGHIELQEASVRTVQVALW